LLPPFEKIWRRIWGGWSVSWRDLMRSRTGR
jgi:hypothetical protein